MSINTLRVTWEVRGNAAGKKEKKEPIVYNNIFDKGPACNSEGKTKKVRACCKYTIEHASDQLIALAPIFNAFFPWERNKQLELISSNKCSQYAPPKVGLGKKTVGPEKRYYLLAAKTDQRLVKKS